MSGQLEEQTTQRIALQQSGLEDRLQYFIHYGRKALETELQAIEADPTITPEEKEQQKLRTLQEYANAKIMQKSAVLRVNEYLLDHILNPYASLAQLSAMTASRQNEDGLWSSDFNPDTIERGLSPYISRPILEEIRAGIQLALQMRTGVKKLIEEHRGYNGRPDARAILKSLYGVEIKGQARVVDAGPLSITIVILDSNDYGALLGDPEKGFSSGGFHGNYLKTGGYFAEFTREFGQQYSALRFETKGLVNICKGYEHATTVNHENEHSLYEILIKNRGQHYSPMQSLIEHLPNVPEGERERLLESTFRELLFEARNRYIAQYANEVLAYGLNNESPTSDVSGVVERTFRRLTESELYSHHHLTDAVINDIKDQLLSVAPTLAQSGVGATLVASYEKKVHALTRQQLVEIYKSIAKTVAQLHNQYPNRKNYIRALLAGENPARWESVAKAVYNHT